MPSHAKKYRKKPIVISATKFAPNMILPGEDLPNRVVYTGKIGGQLHNWFVNTDSGQMRVVPGDYVITGIKGEVYPCKADIFEATYEEV